MSAALMLLSQLVYAETSADIFESFVSQIQSQDYKAALKTAAMMDDVLLTQSELISPQLLPDFWMYRGLAYSNRRKREEAIKAWRQAVRIDIELLSRAEATGIFGIEQLDIIAALTQETSAQHERRLDIPSQTGQIQYFLDGKVVKAGTLSHEGRHLLQINCPLDPFQSVWVDSLQGIDWLSYCPSGMGEAKAAGIPGLGDLSNLVIPPPIITTPAPESPPNSEPKDLEPEAVPDTATAETTYDLAPLSTERDASKDQVEIMIIPSNDLRDRLGMGCMIGGGVFFASGVVLHFTAVRPRYALIEAARANPESVTRIQANQLTDSFNSSRWTTIALLGAGAAMSGSGAAVYFTASGSGAPMLGTQFFF